MEYLGIQRFIGDHMLQRVWVYTIYQKDYLNSKYIKAEVLEVEWHSFGVFFHVTPHVEAVPLNARE